MANGHWTEKRDDKDVRGSILRIGSVFRGEVRYADDKGWACALNGESMGAYPTLAGAKARIDWEVWNRLHRVRADYEVPLARKPNGETAANKYRWPEYRASDAARDVKNQEPELIGPVKP